MAKAVVEKYARVNLELTEQEARFLNYILNVTSSGSSWYYMGQPMVSVPKALAQAVKELDG